MAACSNCAKLLGPERKLRKLRRTNCCKLLQIAQNCGGDLGAPSNVSPKLYGVGPTLEFKLQHMYHRFVVLSAFVAAISVRTQPCIVRAVASLDATLLTSNVDNMYVNTYFVCKSVAMITCMLYSDAIPLY